MFRLSIVTIHYHCMEVLQSLLDSAATLGPMPDTEWIIIDHSPTQPPLEKRLAFPSNIGSVKVVAASSNEGFGGGCNLGASHSSGRFIFFLNPDCCFRGGSLALLLDRLQTDETIGALCPRMLAPDGKVEFSFAAFPGLFNEARIKFEKRLYNASPIFRYILDHRFNHLRWVDWVTGGAMLVNREAFLKVGGFDSDFFLYFEDADLCLRLHQAGFRIGFDPAFALVHDHGHGGSVKPSKGSKSHLYRQSQIRYYQKHKSPLARALLKGYLKLSGKYSA